MYQHHRLCLWHTVSQQSFTLSSSTRICQTECAFHYFHRFFVVTARFIIHFISRENHTFQYKCIYDHLCLCFRQIMYSWSKCSRNRGLTSRWGETTSRPIGQPILQYRNKIVSSHIQYKFDKTKRKIHKKMKCIHPFCWNYQNLSCNCHTNPPHRSLPPTRKQIHLQNSQAQGSSVPRSTPWAPRRLVLWKNS